MPNCSLQCADWPQQASGAIVISASLIGCYTLLVMLLEVFRLSDHLPSWRFESAFSRQDRACTQKGVDTTIWRCHSKGTQIPILIVTNMAIRFDQQGVGRLAK